jgi:hypothetical protein
MDAYYSYHVFLFPFKWYDTSNSKNELLDKESLKTLKSQRYSNWVHSNPITPSQAEELYNEKNYYYPFVHEALYDQPEENDDPLMHHYEHQCAGWDNVNYIIELNNGKKYTLKVDAINLNFYSTGVGMLSFYLKNQKENQKEKEDILCINQYGRRIMPPFYADIVDRNETAKSLSITGINDNSDLYREDFNAYSPSDAWKPAGFITQLIRDFNPKLEIKPIVDDRMVVLCWYGNESLGNTLKHNPDDIYTDEFWYKYFFVDATYATCQHDKMKKKLIEDHSYLRWQNYQTIYGVTGHSFMLLTDRGGFALGVLRVQLRTIYSRMIELCLMQRASLLRFSEEVCRLSKLRNTKKHRVVEDVSDLNREYIRFVNQIYFREVTSQDQGIELYEKILKSMPLSDHIKDLDHEIGELHQYASLIEDRNRSSEARTLNWIATIFLPASFMAGVFGMNIFGSKDCEIGINWWITTISIVLASVITYGIIRWIGRKRHH